MADVVLVASVKGGVGKTTTAVTLAAASVSDVLHRATPTLVLDLDPQASATTWALGRDAMYRLMPEHTVAAWARGGRLYHNAHPVPLPGVTCPTHPFRAVSGVHIVAACRTWRTTDLADLALDTHDGLVVVDCPPDMDTPLVRSLAPYVRAVVVPVTPEPACIPSVGEVVGWCVDNDRPELADTMLVVPTFVGRCAIHQVCESVIRQTYGERVWPQTFARTVAVPEAELRGEVVKAASAPGKLFAALWRDVVGRMEATRRWAA